MNFPSISSHIHNWALFLLWLHLCILSGVISPLFPSSILDTWEGSSFSVLSFCLFVLFVGFSRQEYWRGLPSPSLGEPCLSELSTMTHASWVALHGMAHTFIELDKIVVHMVSLISFEVSSNVVVLKMWSRGFCFWDYGVEVFIHFPLFLLVSTTKHSGYFFVKKTLRVYKRKRRQTGIRSPRNGTVMSSLSSLLASCIDLQLKLLATQKHKQPQTKKKKKTTKKLLQKKSGLGPGKSSLARQKTFKHKLLNPNTGVGCHFLLLVKVWSLLKIQILELHPRLLELETWGWSSALCVLTGPPSDSDACWSFRTTDTVFLQTKELEMRGWFICPR